MELFLSRIKIIIIIFINMDSIVGVAVFVDFIDNILTLVIPWSYLSSQVKSSQRF